MAEKYVIVKDMLRLVSILSWTLQKSLDGVGSCKLKQ